MAETPHRAQHARPISPFVTIYRWTPTMASSITHRLSGIALAAGSAVIAWWLMASASGPQAFDTFSTTAASVLGQLVLFGFAWALSFHLLNGARHLLWDLGYGYEPKIANQWSVIIFVVSLLIPAALFGLAYAGFGGFYK